MTPPANPDELAKYVQYRLGMMGEENAHHRFEELCFRLAKATVASNLMPPSGPVSAGGDQGRDFESFRVEGAGGNVTHFFAASISADDTVVFACTTQRGSDADLRAKIRSDVATACSREPRPTVVYFYASSVTLAPAARHRAQDDARADHGIRLEVVDQRAIAELLTDPPCRWLAQHYLSVPADMLGGADPGPPRPAWYEEARARFADAAERHVSNHAELALVVRCVRHAWETEGLEPDDGLWLDLLGDLWGAPDGFSTERGLRAFYEAFVYLLRGRERCGLEEHIPSYVEGLIVLDDLGLAQDAQCFASYLLGGVARGHVDLPFDTAREQFRNLVSWLEEKIEHPPGPLVLSDLLVARGSLVFCEAALEPEPPTDDAVAALATETLTWWSRALDVGGQLVSFPLLRLGELLAKIAPALAESADYDGFVARLDQACEERLAGESVAMAMRDRAMRLFDAERYLDALPPMLAARRHWHNGDRLRGSLLASMIAELCLERLGLLWAAKRVLLDVAAVCCRSGDRANGDLLAEAVFRLAALEYLLGEWATSLQTYRLALNLHLEYASDPWNFEKHERLQHGLFYIVMMLVVGEQSAPGFSAWGKEVVAAWEVDDQIDQFGEVARKNWDAQVAAGGLLKATCPLHGPPLADLRSQRCAGWSALGLDWEVTWDRDYTLESVATEFAAVLQFLQAGLARKRYAHLLPTSVLVEIVPWEDGTAPVQPMPGRDRVAFEVRLPASESSDDPMGDLRMIALFAATKVIEAVSVDPDIEDRLPKLGEGMVQDGVFVGGSALEGRAVIAPADLWQRLQEVPSATQSLVLEAVPKTELVWRAGRSPSHTPEAAAEKLRQRYEGGFRTARPVLDAHGAGGDLPRLVEELRADGWLDWQIAGALAPAAVSLRANLEYQRGASQRTVQRLMGEGMRQARDGAYSAPAWSKDFERSIRVCLEGSLVSALKAWGLGVNYPAPDLQAVRHFLEERFLHFSHDLPPDERPRFPWEGRPA